MGERVLEQLTSVPGQVRFVNELAELTGLTTRQVQQAIANMRATNSTLRQHIQILTRGSSWRYVDDAGGQLVEPTKDEDESDGGGVVPDVDDDNDDGAPSSRRSDLELHAVGWLDDGALLVSDSNGELWTARRIQLNGGEA